MLCVFLIHPSWKASQPQISLKSWSQYYNPKVQIAFIAVRKLTAKASHKTVQSLVAIHVSNRWCRLPWKTTSISLDFTFHFHPTWKSGTHHSLYKSPPFRPPLPLSPSVHHSHCCSEAWVRGLPFIVVHPEVLHRFLACFRLDLGFSS